jgi:murein DD-endopeptidase MepM/ murein hydrolase activator NlpD
MHKSLIALLLFSIMILTPTSTIRAQDQTTNPTYIVQSGDTLSLIAVRFGVTVDELIKANNITDPNAINAGTQLIIPGLEGISGVLTTTAIPLGENFRSESLRFQISREILSQLNRVISPSEVYAGSNLIIPVAEEKESYQARAILDQGQSLLEVSVAQSENPWVLINSNMIQNSWQAIPGETLFSPPRENGQEISAISPDLIKVAITPLPLKQGDTAVIRVISKRPMNLTGTLDGQALHFFSQETNNYVALQGIHAMSNEGLSLFSLKNDADGSAPFEFDQSFLLQSGNYGKDPPLSVDPETIDPAITGPEDAKIASVAAPATPTKYWDGIFQAPIDKPLCIKSWYGTRRSYNGSDYTYFHTGLDFGVCANNLNIYAAAPGVVVFTGSLTVRGNSAVIDHGWGVYTGYWHQSEILVKEGDHVTAGQIIGQIGKTGRVTGPHLHWDVWVNGVQVNPMYWLDNAYP